MNKITPTISSGVAGPLGVLHLPRLWHKASLDCAGKLHDDYAAAGQGLDQLVLDGLGLSRDAFLAFLADRKPTYPQLEDWVREQGGGAADAAAIAEVNAAIAGYEYEDEVRAEILADCGVADNGAVWDALTLNNLDDWAAFHREEIAGA